MKGINGFNILFYGVKKCLYLIKEKQTLIYLSFRIENLIYVKREKNKKCFEDLTMAPIDKDLINEKLLTSIEKKYLFNYNMEIYSNISKFLTKNEKNWVLNSII